MRRELAEFTKKAWEMGLLRQSEAPQALAEVFFKQLTQRYPKASKRTLALKEIEKDIRRSLLVLNYGRQFQL